MARRAEIFGQLPRSKSGVLHICHRKHPPSHVERVITEAGYTILLAATLATAVAQLPLAGVLVISSCWEPHEKGQMATELKARSALPIICLYAGASAQCGHGTEISDFDAVALVTAIRNAFKDTPTSGLLA